MATYHLAEIKKNEPFPGRENLLRITQRIPDEPPDPEAFQNWITQSVNQFSGDVYRRVASDIRNAAGFGTMVFTDEVGAKSVETSVGVTPFGDVW